ncbi:hypothetical protein KKE60_07620 [Patescibacteria group bacterium]|nr:hypothetical protein [Patescibacteria group bacterium]
MAEVPVPTHDEVVFGDGSMAQIIKVRERKNEEGIEGDEFILNPSREIKEHFGLKSGVELHPVLGYVKKWYPKTSIIRPEAKFPTARWLITTDFEGDETNWSRKHISDTELIKDLQRENKILKMERARTYKTLELATSQQVQFFKWNAEMIKEARKAGGRIETEEDIESKEQQQEEIK